MFWVLQKSTCFSYQALYPEAPLTYFNDEGGGGGVNSDRGSHFPARTNDDNVCVCLILFLTFHLACGHTLVWESILSFISMETVHLTYARREV